MRINLGQGGPVVLAISITNQFDWSYSIKLRKSDETDIVFEKAQLMSGSETVTLAADADEIRGREVEVVVTLDPGTGNTTKADILAEVSVGGATKTPAVIDEKTADIDLRGNFFGAKELA